MIARTLLTMLIATLCAMPTFAVPVLDQDYDARATGVSGGISITGGQVLYQTFTVGVEGTLDAIDLQVYKAFSTPNPVGDLVVAILGTSSGDPDPTNILGTVSVSGIDLPDYDINSADFLNVDVSSLNIAIAPGDILAFRLTRSNTNDFFNLADRDGELPDYVGGALYVAQNTTNTPAEVTNSDGGFRTYVEPIPEPSSLALLGLGGLLVARRRVGMHRGE